LVLRLLQRRVGALPAKLARQFDRLDNADIAALGDALHDFENLGDAQQWFVQRKKPVPAARWNCCDISGMTSVMPPGPSSAPGSIALCKPSAQPPKKGQKVRSHFSRIGFQPFSAPGAGRGHM